MAERLYGGNKWSFGVTECEDGWIEVCVYHDNRHVRKVLDLFKSNPRELLRRNWKGLRAAIWMREVIKDFRSHFEDGRVRIIFPSAKSNSARATGLRRARTSNRVEAIEEVAMSPKDACAKLHELLEQLPLYGVDIDLDRVPRGNGIYFFYEKTGGEWERSGHAQDAKGIVRIGISRGTQGRVSHHYYGIMSIDSISLDTLRPKDRSVMRGHIGQALLNRPGHLHASYLPIWKQDMTPKANKDAFRHRRNVNIEKAIEREVSDAMAGRFWFRCVPGESHDEVKQLETSAIGIVSSCPTCCRSPGWLGRSHPNRVISQGRLWNVKKVTAAYSEPLRLDLLARRIAQSL